MNKKLLALVLVSIAGFIFFFKVVRKTKRKNFLEARNRSCERLEKRINKVYKSERNLSSGANIKECNCYYTPEIPNKEIEKKTKNYCTCKCQTERGTVKINVRKTRG